MKKFMMNVLVAGSFAAVQVAHAQTMGENRQIDNFGWQANKTKEIGLADLLDSAMVNRAIVTGPDTLIFIPCKGKEANGHLIWGRKADGRNEIQAWYNDNFYSFSKSTELLSHAVGMSAKVERYSASKHGPINTWVYK